MVGRQTVDKPKATCALANYGGSAYSGRDNKRLCNAQVQKRKGDHARWCLNSIIPITCARFEQNVRRKVCVIADVSRPRLTNSVMNTENNRAYCNVNTVQNARSGAIAPNAVSPSMLIQSIGNAQTASVRASRPRITILPTDNADVDTHVKKD